MINRSIFSEKKVVISRAGQYVIYYYRYGYYTGCLYSLDNLVLESLVVVYVGTHLHGREMKRFGLQLSDNQESGAT